MSIHEAQERFVSETGARIASYLDACVRCGLCAEACHYHQASGNPRHAPVAKFQILDRIYRRHRDPFAPLWRLFGRSRDPDIEELEELRELIFDTCSMCGRCTLICPMAIDIAQMVWIVREGMAAAGLVPPVLEQMARRAREAGSPMGVDPQKLRQILDEVSREYDVELPLDKEKADILLLDSSLDFNVYRPSLAAMAKILNRLGLNWTFSTRGYEASNLGLFTGDVDVARAMVARIVEAAEEVGASIVLAPECGHGYGSIRWEAAELLGFEPPFEILHISEFLARLHREGRLKLRRRERALTYHDPCKVGRRGGVLEEPRELMRDLVSDFREMHPSGILNWCCSGGGGVVLLESARKVQLEAFRIKMRQVEETGAEGVVMACAFCHYTFDSSAKHFEWDCGIEDLVQMVAEQMVVEDA